MIKTLAKLFAYKKAPAKTFAVLHPMKALKWGAALFLVKKIFGSGESKRRTSEAGGGGPR